MIGCILSDKVAAKFGLPNFNSIELYTIRSCKTEKQEWMSFIIAFTIFDRPVSMVIIRYAF